MSFSKAYLSKKDALKTKKVKLFKLGELGVSKWQIADPEFKYSGGATFESIEGMMLPEVWSS